jgi:hypothetical protein
MVRSNPPKNQDFNHGSKVGASSPKCQLRSFIHHKANKVRLPIQIFWLAPTNNTYIIGLGYWSFVGSFIETSNIEHIFQKD